VLGNLTDKTLNKKFKDVFLDFAVPIYQLIFFCTANNTEDIELFLLSRLTPVTIKPYNYQERLEIAHDLITYNFHSYKIADLIPKFSEKLIKKCLTREWGIRGLKDNIERIAYKAFLWKRRKKLPADWDTANWAIIDKEEVDAGDPQRNRPACPYSEDRTAQHRKGCECFKPELIEGWAENMTA